MCVDNQTLRQHNILHMPLVYFPGCTLSQLTFNFRVARQMTYSRMLDKATCKGRKGNLVPNDIWLGVPEASTMFV